MKKRTLKRGVRIFLYLSLIIFLFVAYLYFKQAQKKHLSITNFDECVSAGYQILTTYPEQCKIPGKVFVNTSQTASETIVSTTTLIAKKTNPKNTSYDIEGRMFNLDNGTATKVDLINNILSTTTVRYFGNELRVEINEDNRIDSAFIITSDNSGVGAFYYLVVAILNENGEYEGTNGALIGDRVVPKTTEFVNGEIVVKYFDRPIESPMTTKPTILTSRYFKVSNDTLIEITK